MITQREIETLNRITKHIREDIIWSEGEGNYDIQKFRVPVDSDAGDYFVFLGYSINKFKF